MNRVWWRWSTRSVETDDDLRPVGIMLMEMEAKLDRIVRLLEEDDDEWQEAEDDAE